MPAAPHPEVAACTPATHTESLYLSDGWCLRSVWPTAPAPAHPIRTSFPGFQAAGVELQGIRMDGDITGTCFTLGQSPEPETFNNRYNTGTAGASCMYTGSVFRCCCLVVAVFSVDTCTGSRGCNCLWHSDTQRVEPGAAPLSRTGRICRSIVRLELFPVTGNDAGVRRHGAATATGFDNLCGYVSFVQCVTWVNRQAEAPVMQSPASWIYSIRYDDTFYLQGTEMSGEKCCLQAICRALV